MKILITGMNNLQCVENYYEKQHIKVIPPQYSLISCLRDMGHTVIQKIVTVGENLDEYDKVILFISTSNGFASTKLYNGLWAAYTVPIDKLILSFDDWQVDSIMNSLRYTFKTDNLFIDFKLTVNKSSLDNLIKYKENLMSGIEKIISNKIKILFPAFSGGDLSGVIKNYPTHLIYSYNPNPYNANKTPEKWDGINSSNIFFDDPKCEAEEKEKKFIFASLVAAKTKHWLDSLHIKKWEILTFNSKNKVLEIELVKIFNKNWGVLLPKYFCSGTGFPARPRVLQTAHAESILVCDESDSKIYYGNNFSHIKACDIEDLNCLQLKELALKQRQALYKTHPLSKEVQISEISNVLGD